MEIGNKLRKVEAIKQTFKFLAENSGRLSDSQLNFVKSLQKYFRKNKQLSERQQKILFEIEKYYQLETQKTEKILNI